MRGDPRIKEPVIGRWTGDRIAVVGDYAEDGDLSGALPDPVSAIYDCCNEGAYSDISALVRPLLAAELGIEYHVEPCRTRHLDGAEDQYERWRFRRDPAATFSILDD